MQTLGPFPSPSNAELEMNHDSINENAHSLLHFPRNRAVWWVALAILVSRLLLISFAVHLAGDDGDRYLKEGSNLIRYGIFSHYPLRSGHNIPGETGYNLTGPAQASDSGGSDSRNPQPTAHDLPAYPVILAGLVFLLKDLWVVARVAAVLNAIGFTIAAIELYGCIRLAGAPRRVAVWAMVFLGISPESFPYSVFHMPESFFLAAFLGCIGLVVLYLREPRPATLLLAFALLGFTVLLKPISLFFFGPVVVLICVRYCNGANRARVAVALFLSLLLETAILCPWLVRNYRVFGTFSLCTVTGNNLFYINYPTMLADQGLSGEAIKSLQLERLSAVEKDPGFQTNAMVRANALQKIATLEIVRHPFACAKSVTKRAPRLYVGTGVFASLQLLGRMPDNIPMDDHRRLAVLRRLNSVSLCSILAWALLAALYLLAARGLVRLLRQHLWPVLILACVPLFYFTLMYGPVTASARYRLLVTPFLAILAGFGAGGGGSSLSLPVNVLGSGPPDLS